MVEKAIRKCRVAEQIAAPRLRSLAPAVREEAITTLTDLGVEWPSVWCQELLRIKVEERPETIETIMWPYPRPPMNDDDSDAEASNHELCSNKPFDPAAPRLACVKIQPYAKVRYFNKTLVECVLVPAIGNGEAGKTLLATLDQKLTKLIAATKEFYKCGLPEASHDDPRKKFRVCTGAPSQTSCALRVCELCVIVCTCLVIAREACFLDELGAALATIRVLMDPSPQAALDAAPYARQIRSVLSSQCPEAWTPINDAIDGDPTWSVMKAEYRRTVLNDHRVAGKFQQASRTLQDMSFSKAVAEVLASLDEWKSFTRVGATAAIELQVIVRLEADIEALRAAGSDNELALRRARELDQLVLQAAKKCLVDGSEAEKARVQNLRSSARKLCEDMAKSFREHRVIKAMENFTQAPTAENLMAVRDSHADGPRARFQNERDVQLIFEVCTVIKASITAEFDVGDETLPRPPRIDYGKLHNEWQCATGLLEMAPASDRSSAWARFFCDVGEVWNVLVAHKALTDLCATAEEQAEHADGVARAEALRLAFASMLQAGAWNEGAAREDGDGEPTTEVMGLCGKHVRAAQDAMAKFCAAVKVGWESELASKLHELVEVAGGQAAGASWKADVEATADWPSVAEHASRTLLSRAQKGLAKSIRSAKALLTSAFDRVKQERAALDIRFDVDEWKSQLDTAFKAADITVMEAILIKLLKDDKLKDVERRHAVQKEMDRLLDTQLTPDDIHPAIWAEAQRALL